MKSSSYEEGMTDIDGSRQQVINFWLSHELDHNDNHGNDNMISGLSSDIAAINTLSGSDKENIVESLIHMRVREEISRVASGTLVHKLYIGRDDYSFAPYIKSAMQGDLNRFARAIPAKF